MWIQSWGLLLPLTYLLPGCAANFTFTSYSEALQCDDFQVSWKGGTPPFSLTILPSFDVQTHVNIPDNAFRNNKGSYGAPMPARAGSRTVVVMSDSTGFGSGGVSPVIKVGNSKSNNVCAPSPRFDYYFTVDNHVQQCEAIVFHDYDQAVQPVTITGVIPGGSTFVLNPPNGSKNLTWIVDVAAETDIMFFMVDSVGRQGGTTNILRVQHGPDRSCLDNSSPASTANAPSLMATSTTPTGTHAGTVPAPSSTPHIKTGTLIAAIVVPLIAVIALVIGAFIWYRRRRRNGGVRVLGPRKPRQPVVDLMKGDPDTPPHMEEVGSPTTASTPFLHGRSPSAGGETSLGGVSSLPQTSATTSPSGASSSGIQPDGQGGGRRKAAEAAVLAPPGHQPATRFILHTDIEDTVPPSPVEEVIELPPQYSERRGAGPAASGSDSQPQVGEPSVPQPS